MRKYHSDNKNYNAILDAMAEIRHNQLNESYMYEGEHEDEEMAEEMDDEEAEVIAEMMDEALYELDEEDDEDNLTEADGDRKSRRRNRLRQALLIGAGLAAAGLGTAAGSKFVAQGGLGGFGQETARAFRGAVGGGIDDLGRMISGSGDPNSGQTTQNKLYRQFVRDPLTRAAVMTGAKGRRMDADMNPLNVRATGKSYFGAGPAATPVASADRGDSYLRLATGKRS